MSTWFVQYMSGIGSPGLDAEGVIVDYSSSNFNYRKVARRWSGGVEFLTPSIPDYIRIYPIDNTPQGVYTIKDLKQWEINRKINLQVKKELKLGKKNE